MISILPSVRIKRLSPAACRVLDCLSNTIDQTITSANDGKHALDSRHYLNRAFDLRAKDKTDDQIKTMVDYLFSKMAFIRIKIELDNTDRHWVTSAAQIRFPKVRSANQHLHLEWEE